MEQFFLEIIADFLLWYPGRYVMLGIGALFVLFQFLWGKGRIWPAAIGATFIMVCLFQSYKGEEYAAWILADIEARNTEGYYREPIPIVEDIFAYFLGESSGRTLAGEIFFVFAVAYILAVVWEACFSGNAVRTGGGGLSMLPIDKLMFWKKNRNQRPSRSFTNELGSGDLATTEQVLNWTKSSGKAGDTALMVNTLKGSQGVALKAGHLVWPKEQRNRHILIIAKTGSGKTTKMILPILYNDCMCKERSTIVIDSKPEMWSKLAGYTAKFNPEKEILRFNPLDTVRSLSWNILGKIEDDTDCKLIANTIIMATDVPSAKSDSPFFRNNALAILNSIMVGLLYDSNERLSMPRIHELIQSGMKNLTAWLEQHPEAYRTSRTFCELAKSGSQNADTIMSELSMRVAAWDLKAIRATTAFDEVDLELLISKPTLFIVEFRESELEMLRPMANVIVVELLRFLTKRAESMPNVTLPRPVSLVIDEFASALGRLPDIHVKLNTLRSRNVSICAAIQSTAQVKANYADDSDSVLAGFSTKIFMPSLDLVDSEWASKESGQMTVRFKIASTGSNKRIIDFFASRNDSLQEQVQQRAVLTPDEVGKPVDNISTFFMPNTPVFQGYLIPYYEQPELYAKIKQIDESVEPFSLRNAPIEYEETLPPVGGDGGAGIPTGSTAHLTDTKGWTEDQIRKKLEEVKKTLEWSKTTGSAKKWWEAFEKENATRLALVLRLAEELKVRRATVTEFFLSYVYSATDNIQANLHYLDYTRIKKDEEKRKKGRGPQSTTAPKNSQASGGAA